MHGDGENLDFVYAVFAVRHNIALGASKKRWKMFHRNEATFLWSRGTQLEMPKIRCRKKRDSIAHRLQLVLFLKSVSGFFDEQKAYTVTDRPNNDLQFR